MQTIKKEKEDAPPAKLRPLAKGALHSSRALLKPSSLAALPGEKEKKKKRAHNADKRSGALSDDDEAHLIATDNEGRSTEKSIDSANLAALVTAKREQIMQERRQKGIDIVSKGARKAGGHDESQERMDEEKRHEEDMEKVRDHLNEDSEEVHISQRKSPLTITTTPVRSPSTSSRDSSASSPLQSPSAFDTHIGNKGDGEGTPVNLDAFTQGANAPAKSDVRLGRERSSRVLEEEEEFEDEEDEQEEEDEESASTKEDEEERSRIFQQYLSGDNNNNDASAFDELSFGEHNDDEMEDEEEDEQAEVAVAYASALSKLANTSISRDKSEAHKTVINAISKQMEDLKCSRTDTTGIPLKILEVDNEDEIDDDYVEKLEKEFKRKSITVSGQTLLAWPCAHTNKYVVVDGRHRLKAIIACAKKAWNEKTPELRAQSDPMDMKVRVTIVHAGQLAACIKKLAMEATRSPTVFEQVARVRFILKGLGMINNSALTTEIKIALINRHIGSTTSSAGRGVPRYTVKAACAGDTETRFFEDNVRVKHLDGCRIIRAYLRAYAVHPTRALELLTELDGETDKKIIEDGILAIEAMHNSITDLLMMVGYDDEEAYDIQNRMVANSVAFTTIKRLVTGKNRLNPVNHEKKTIANFLKELETCLPPITFIRPRGKAYQNMKNAACTLVIIDNEAFQEDEVVKGLVGLVRASPPRVLNIIIVGAREETVKSTLNVACEQRRRGRTASQSAVAAFTIDVGASEVAVDCVEHSVIGDADTVTKKSVPACLLRATCGHFLNQSQLNAFMVKMRVHGSVSRTCLRLLSFDSSSSHSSSEEDPSDHNRLFVHGHTPGPIAIAAYASANRLSYLTSLDEGLQRELLDKQKNVNDEWIDFPAYKDAYTLDGAVRDNVGMKKTRKRMNKYKEYLGTSKSASKKKKK